MLGPVDRPTRTQKDTDAWSLHYDDVTGHEVAPVKEKTNRGQYLRKVAEYAVAGDDVSVV